MILKGNSLERLKEFPDNYFSSVVTDPPYGLAFMGKKWDYDVPSVALWTSVHRVLKPGGHLLSFGGTRTYHRMVVEIEDAGFEIRDQVQWIYSQGYPKSLNISDGRGTALKPANEPICLARKPLSEKTVVQNVARWGTGALNIDASRIPGKPWSTKAHTSDSLMVDKRKDLSSKSDIMFRNKPDQQSHELGRWPSNVLLDEHCAELLGEPSRFFYVAKASKRERNAGLEGMPERESGVKNDSGRGFSESDPYKKITNQNFHPTVKPIRLMEYLIRLITPPAGIVLDPFAGSGSTLIAAKKLGFVFVGIELDEHYAEIARKRLEIA